MQQFKDLDPMMKTILSIVMIGGAAILVYFLLLKNDAAAVECNSIVISGSQDDRACTECCSKYHDGASWRGSRRHEPYSCQCTYLWKP